MLQVNQLFVKFRGMAVYLWFMVLRILFNRGLLISGFFIGVQFGAEAQKRKKLTTNHGVWRPPSYQT